MCLYSSHLNANELIFLQIQIGYSSNPSQSVKQWKCQFVRKKLPLYFFGCNFAKCRPIFLIFSPTNFSVILWKSDKYISHHTSNASLHYLVKCLCSIAMIEGWVKQTSTQTLPFKTIAQNIHPTYFWATVCKTVCPMLSDRCMSVLSVCLSVCNVRALWPNGWTDQNETWHAGRSRPWPHCVK